ncbi:hypothetical protein JWG42_08570 [Desulfoprunum benzoelyticum]|uniref:Uncharacterized protein n=1 Tax=Desulfoprunum benzoelyticum TaxID=1506996 RepID=A0A840UUI7_9BACT|nr:hypothetical protein [Desulfoprunum benzoelyticum]MBB5348463.1 hypothetical protein [Desulfoprunum benzoelyticum]MBM9530202.1 hypothetical protein [Desulfoprunum benzoelyticum]
MTEYTKIFNVIVAVDSTYMNESFWTSVITDYMPFLAQSFQEMGADVSKRFVCITRQDDEARINASLRVIRKHSVLQQFAETVKGSPCPFDIPAILRFALEEAEQTPLQGLIIFAASQRQPAKAKALENEIRPLAQRLKALGVTTFIFDSADEHNLVSSHISGMFGKTALWANGMHVSFHSGNLRVMYEYMKLIGPVVAADLGALKRQSGDLITVHGKHLFRKCLMRLDPGAKKG